jgi:hypothetical protein
MLKDYTRQNFDLFEVGLTKWEYVVARLISEANIQKGTGGSETGMVFKSLPRQLVCFLYIVVLNMVMSQNSSTSKGGLILPTADLRHLSCIY